MNRRDFLLASSATAASVAMLEFGGIGAARAAERSFTVSMGGGSWGEGMIEAYINRPGFEQEHGISVAYDYNQDNVRSAKALAKCGDPEFSAVECQNLQAILLADRSCVQSYDLDLVPNYKDLHAVATEGPRGPLENWFGAQLLLILALTWNPKVASAPSSYEDLLKPEYKGRIGVPSFEWMGLNWLHVVNRSFGGKENDVTQAIDFVSDLVKKNDAVVVQNPDFAMKAFEREEIVMMPYWNGRTFAMQEQGIDVQIEYVPGSLVVANGYVITAGSGYTELANRFVNNTLDGEFQLEMVRRFRYLPGNAKVKLPAEIAHYDIEESKRGNLVQLDFATINEHRAETLDLWNQKVVS